MENSLNTFCSLHNQTSCRKRTNEFSNCYPQLSSYTTLLRGHLSAISPYTHPHIRKRLWYPVWQIVLKLVYIETRYSWLNETGMTIQQRCNSRERTQGKCKDRSTLSLIISYYLSSAKDRAKGMGRGKEDDNIFWSLNIFCIL